MKTTVSLPNCLHATDCTLAGIPGAAIIAWYASFARSNFDWISKRCAIWNWISTFDNEQGLESNNANWKC